MTAMTTTTRTSIIGLGRSMTKIVRTSYPVMSFRINDLYSVDELVIQIQALFMLKIFSKAATKGGCGRF